MSVQINAYCLSVFVVVNVVRKTFNVGDADVKSVGESRKLVETIVQ